jgi:hypothetical protein
MGWPRLLCPQLHTLRRRCVYTLNPYTFTEKAFLPDPIRPHFFACVLTHGHGHWLWKVLQLYFRNFWRPRWETRGGRPCRLVEQVTDSDIIFSVLLMLMFSRQIFPSYSTAQRPLAKNSALARIREKRARMKQSVSVPNSGNSSV